MSSSSFQPLGDIPQAIRLVRVIGRDKKGYINCSLRSTSLGQNEYTALSHVWGSNSPTCRITLEGKPFWIRPNLHTFLTYALEAFRDVEFWIDALCINQDNVAEKNQQIPLMGEIYSRASRVISWLHWTIATTSGNLSCGQSDPNSFGCSLLVAAMEDSPSTNLGLGDESRDLIVATTTRLVEHEYWSRLWIVPELSLAIDFALLWEGQLVEWAKLRSLISTAMSNSTLSDDLNGKLATYFANQHTRTDAFPIMSFLHGDGSREVDGSGRGKTALFADHTLFELVSQYQHHQCSVPHDRVYALRDLAIDGHQLQPDYAKSRVALLAEVLTIDATYRNRYRTVEDAALFGRLLDINIDDWIELNILHEDEGGTEGLPPSSILTRRGKMLQHCARNEMTLNQWERKAYRAFVCLPGHNLYLALESFVFLSDVHHYLSPDAIYGMRPVLLGAETDQVQPDQQARHIHFRTYDPISSEFRCLRQQRRMQMRCRSWFDLHDMLRKVCLASHATCYVVP